MIEPDYKAIALNSARVIEEFSKTVDDKNEYIKRLENSIWSDMHTDHSWSPVRIIDWLEEIKDGHHDKSNDYSIKACYNDWAGEPNGYPKH